MKHIESYNLAICQQNTSRYVFFGVNSLKFTYILFHFIYFTKDIMFRFATHLKVYEKSQNGDKLSS